MTARNLRTDRTPLGKMTLTRTLILLVICLTPAFAGMITPEMASRVACNHLQSMRQEWGTLAHLDGETLELAVLTELRAPESSELLGYVAELAPRGFVVLSADTRITPVLAYSFHSDFPWEEGYENTLLYMVRTDLDLRNQAIPLTAPDLLAANERLWERYLSGQLSAPATEQWPKSGSTPTGGWVETTWTQGSPYNMYCPTDPGSGRRCVVGCVATAMSQIVDYHSARRDYMGKVEFGTWDRYTSDLTSPVIRIDQDASSYNFPHFTKLNEYLVNTRDKYVNDNQPTSADLAALCFACGVSVKMRYSSHGSGASTSKVAVALLNKFEYTSAKVMSGTLGWFYETLSSNMKDSMPAELAIYHADYTSGHAIVCDGLRETEGQEDKYHLNFGWGASSPNPISTAWYELPEGMPAGYRIVYNGVVSIVPPEASYQPDNLISIYADGGFTGDDVYNSDGSGQAITTDQDFNKTTIYYLKVQNDGNLDHKIRVMAEEHGNSNWEARYYVHETNQEITAKITQASGWLTDEFEPGEETLLRVEVTVPANAEMGERYTVDITSQSATEEDFTDVVSIITSAAIEENHSSPPPNFYLTQINPNPVQDAIVFTYGLPHPAKMHLAVYDVNGRLLKNLKRDNAPAGHHLIVWDTRDEQGDALPSGAYFTILRTEQESYGIKTVLLR